MDAELLADICDKIMSGQSLREICRNHNLPESSVRRWIAKDDDAMAQYARACEHRADVLFDEVLEIADDKTMSADDRRIAIDARKWASGKLNGKYSDKLTVNSNKTVTHKYDLNSLDTERLEQLESILADARRGAGETGEPVASSLH